MEARRRVGAEWIRESCPERRRAGPAASRRHRCLPRYQERRIGETDRSPVRSEWRFGGSRPQSGWHRGACTSHLRPFDGTGVFRFSRRSIVLRDRHSRLAPDQRATEGDDMVQIAAPGASRDRRRGAAHSRRRSTRSRDRIDAATGAGRARCRSTARSWPTSRRRSRRSSRSRAVGPASSWRASRADNGWRATRSSAPARSRSLTLARGRRDRRASRQDGRATPYDDPLARAGGLCSSHIAALTAPGLPRFLGGAVGYLSYEAVRAFEPRVGAAPGRGLGLPDGRFMLVDGLLVFDHLERTIKVVSHVSRWTTDSRSRRPTPRRRRGSTSSSPCCARRPRSCRAAARPIPMPAVDRCRLEHDAGALPPDRRAGQGVHRRRRHLPGRPLAASRRADTGPPVHDLPGPADDQPVAVHVLPRLRRPPDRRRLAGAAGPAGRADRHQPPDRRHPAARRDAGAGRRARRAICWRTRRSGPSTSCSSTLAATTSGGSRRRVRSTVPA